MSKKPKILIVDDKKANLIALETVLRPIEADVIRANSGEEALKLALEHSFAIALLDVQMPDMDGFELARLLLGDDKTKNLPILFISAVYSEEYYVFKGYNTGAIDFIVKPYDPNILRSKVKVLLRLEQDKVEKLEASEFEYKSTLNSLLVGVIVHDADTRILFSNPQAAHILGMDGESILGKDSLDPVWNFIHEDYTVIKPEDNPVIQVIQSGKAIVNQVLGVQLPDGDRIKWVTLCAIPVFKDGGKLDRVIVNFMDITERKEAEEQMQRLSIVVEQSPEEIVITDVAGTIEYVNPAFEKATGFSREEAIGKNPNILKSNQHQPAFYKDLWDTITSGKVWAGQFINKKKDGQLYTEECTISPVRNAAGKIINFVGIQQDVTKELAREEQFQQAQKMEAVGQLAGGVAHDFNNILQTILSFSELLMSDVEKDENLLDSVQEIQEAARHAADLTQQLLTFSRKQPLKLQEFMLSSALDNIKTMISSILGENITLKLDFPPEQEPIYADIRQIERAILNLSINARDAMPNGGILTISTRHVCLNDEDAENMPQSRKGNFLCLTVCDTGTGIPEEILPKIFEPFFSTKEQGKGTGLGLASVYGIIKEHNGWIQVRSAPEKGTSFEMYLPTCTKGSVPERPVLSSIDRNEWKGSGERILVVEDDPSIRAVCRRALTKAGYIVTLAENADEAEAVFEKANGDFHLLMSDIIMPGRSGAELATALLKQKPDLPVLLCSGYSGNRIEASGLPGKGHFFLSKPYLINDLLKSIYNALHSESANPVLTDSE